MQTGQLMALKDLSISLNKHNISHKGTVSPIAYLDTDIDIACDIVDHIFRHIDLCLKENKSKYQISLFARSFIRGILTDNVKGGINNFLKNMNDEDIRELLDNIQIELDKRHKV
jgi:hypothetical protein